MTIYDFVKKGFTTQTGAIMLRDYQRNLFDEIKNHKLVIIKKSRNVGATFTFIAIALETALNNNANVLIASGVGKDYSMRYARNIYKCTFDNKIKNLVEYQAAIPKLTREYVYSNFLFANGSNITFCDLRLLEYQSAVCDLIIVDEFQVSNQQEKMYELASVHKKCLISGTLEKDDTFNKLWNQAHTAPNNSKALKWDWQTCCSADINDINKIRLACSEEYFKRTYLCEI